MKYDLVYPQMELGRINVRGQNVNLLWQAIHPQHGLVWTNGKAILLEKVCIFDGVVENNTPLKLGEFEHPVKSVHWSSNVGPSTCYLSVIHTQHVSIWKVDGLVPKLSFKQVRKLNVHPVPQGCLWNPGRDILCVLAKQQCSFFFSHTQNKGSYAFPPIESGVIRCGTWTDDGTKLVLCVGAGLMVYSWPEIDSTMSKFYSVVWRIPNLEGSVSSIVSLSNNTVLCAAELPLETLCKVKDTFVIPDFNEKDDNAYDTIVPMNSGSITETLLNLPRSPQCDIDSTTQLITVDLLESREPRMVSMKGVNGILSPELLLFMPHIKSVVIGSNTQNILQVFTFQDGDLTSDLIKTAEIKLDKQERPKGISNVLSPLPNQNGVLITVGRRASSDSAFLSSSPGAAMDIKLKFVGVFVGENVYPSKQNTEEQRSLLGGSHIQEPILRKPSCSSDNVSSLTVEIDDKTLSQVNGLSSVNLDQSNFNRDLHITKQETVCELQDFEESDSSSSSPREIIIGSQSKGNNPVIEELTFTGNSDDELETETTDFSDKEPNFQNDIERGFHDTLDNCMLERVSDKTYLKEKPLERPSLISSMDDSTISLTTSGISSCIPESTTSERMQLEIDKLNHRIEELKMKVGHVTNLIQESTIVTKYQSQSHPELIKIECQCPGMEPKNKTFLLDNGRLQYEAVRSAFELTTLEVIIDREPCVVSPNIDGYIPMRFTPSTTLEITGKAKNGS